MDKPQQTTTHRPPTWPHFRRSIFTKQLTFYLFFIFLVFGGVGLLFFATARGHLEDEVGRQLQHIARIGARNAPLERLELIRIGDDQSRMVLRLKEKMAQIQEATGSENLYIFRPDSTSLLDLNPQVRIGTPYQLVHFKDDFLPQLAQGKAVNTRDYATATGQIFISAYAPVLDLNGQLYAIVGVDADADELAVIDRMRLRLFWIAGAGIAFAALLALFFARSITSPIRQIAQTAEQLGQGDYAARASVQTQDEVGVLAEAINRMAEQVRNRDAALKEMAAGVAHEIRNPLNSIKLLVSLLEEDLSEQEITVQHSTLETLDYEIGKLNRFIEEFLTYARPVALIRDEIPASMLVVSVIDMVAAAAQERDVTLAAENSGDAVILTVDRLRLEQTLLNIALNAVQACGPGGHVVIRTDTTCVDGGVDFVVTDSGPGIQPEALPQLFEPFFTTKADGTGLGLANCKKIVAEHQGHIRAENLPAGGARFTVHLPAERLTATQRTSA